MQPELLGPLRRMRVQAGHRLGVLAGKGTHVAAHRAARALGAVVAPLPADRADDETRRLAAQMGVEAWIADAGTADRVARLASGRPVLAAGRASARLGPPADAPRGLAAILATSGTTGEPRVVGVPEACLAAHAAAACRRLRCGPASAWLALLPLHHVGGVALVDRALRTGCRLVLMERFAPAAALRILRDEAITHVSLVPTTLHRLVAQGAPPPTLRCALVGGDRLDPGLLERALAAGWPVWPSYGLTEACGQVATATPEEARRRRGSVGRPLDGVLVDIVDAAGAALPAGAVGEIRVAGPTVPADFVRTGDLGRLDDGVLTVVGRAEERIVSGGENVDAVAVEAFLRRHPAVADACVVGLPDEEWGERVAAAVVAQDGATVTPAALEAHCRGLAPHERPRRILLVDALPRTPLGKVRRHEVRGQLAGR